MRFRKPEPFVLLFFIGAVMLLAGLGAWQVERLSWKNAQIASMQERRSQPALGTLPQDTEGLEYRNVALTGTFLNDKAFRMMICPHQGESGYCVITPFSLEDDGRVILVNRGFSSRGKETRLEGVQTVAGVIRPNRHKRYFSPANNAEKNAWFYEDFAEMGAAAGVELTPIVVEAVGVEDKGVYPIPSNGKFSLRNDHLNYAITWFSLAIIAIVMFGFYQRIPANKET